jgi:hypothetical protein
MTEWDQIVIGMGTSALTFLHAAMLGSRSKTFVREKTLVIGKRAGQLWSKVANYDPGHKMGQPEHLLRPSGLKPAVKGGHDEFIKTEDYNAYLKKLEHEVASKRKEPIYLLQADVTGITPDGAGYLVETDAEGEAKQHKAKQVIVAGGTGIGSSFTDLDIPVEGENVEGTDEYLDSVDYIAKAQPHNLKVLVYGGSASSSWAVAHAFAMEATTVMWGCRRGLTQIQDEGNPVGRNSETIRIASEKGYIHTCNIEKITVLPGTALQGRMRVKFKDDKPVDTSDFDQVVYALGANAQDSRGPGGILKGGLLDRIVPVWDENYRFSLAKDKKVITALKDKSGDLWVVGAAVFRGLGAKTIQEKLRNGNTNFYATAGEILCSAGRPPEGIAIVDATINALTGFNQTDVKTFNWNKANRRDIFQLLAKVYQMKIPNSVREGISRQIVEERAKTKFGITREQFLEVMNRFVVHSKLKIDPAEVWPETEN